MERKSLLFIELGLCAIFASYVHSQGVQYGCAKDACKNVDTKAREIEKCNGRLIKNGSLLCGCYHICVEQLKRGDACALKAYERLPRTECGNGLKCVGSSNTDNEVGKCDYADTSCVQDLIELKKLQSGTEGYTMGKSKPKCGSFGEYEPVQCKEGMKCYCVDIEGRRIFGTAPYTAESRMTCSCSRDYESYKQYVNTQKDAHKFLRCTAEGDYAPTQCADDKCYCVNSVGIVTKKPVNKEELKDLDCEDEKFEVDNFDTPCIAEYNRKIEVIANMTGKLVLGIEPPSCDLDGSYSAVQCQDFECFCVNKQGERLKQEIKILRNSKQAKTMTCNCMREKALLTTHNEYNNIIDIFSQYKCRDNGNYLPVQCTSAVCFCVDEHEGFQTGPAYMVVNRQSLPCYDKEIEEEIEEKLAIMWD